VYFDEAQFDPALGTLQSISFSFSDLQIFGFGINDISATVGETAQIIATGSVSSSILPINLSSTQTKVYIAGPCLCEHIFQGGFNGGGAFSAPGELFAPAFIGTGTVAVDFTSAPVLQVLPLSTNLFGGINFVQDFETLDITYNYTPVPEPSPVCLALLGIVAIVCVRARSVRATQGRSSAGVLAPQL
jgi:hypothetical protein